MKPAQGDGLRQLDPVLGSLVYCIAADTACRGIALAKYLEDGYKLNR